MNKREMQKAVRRGANLLDKKIPDWHNKIDIGRLNMRRGRIFINKPITHTCGCIGAQLDMTSSSNPDWLNTMRSIFDIQPLTVLMAKASQYGFTATDDQIYDGNDYWDYLKDLWIQEVTDRVGTHA